MTHTHRANIPPSVTSLFFDQFHGTGTPFYGTLDELILAHAKDTSLRDQDIQATFVLYINSQWTSETSDDTATCGIKATLSITASRIHRVCVKLDEDNRADMPGVGTSAKL